MSERGNNRRKPRKPYNSFPLTAHNNGQWCKKIRGKIHFFGVWADPQAALDRYLRMAADLHAGRQPAMKVSADSPTVKDVSNEYLTYQQQRLEAGEIGPAWFENCQSIVRDFASYVGPGCPVCQIVTDDFRRYRQKLVRSGSARRGRGLGVHTLSRSITVIRSMFKYAYDIDLIDKQMKYGRALDRPSAALKRKIRKATEAANGKPVFQASEVRALVRAAAVPMKTMILLGINVGFGNTDCARLPLRSVDFDGSLIEFGRPKTGVERVVPLWRMIPKLERTCGPCL